jgi:hypothetical protein
LNERKRERERCHVPKKNPTDKTGMNIAFYSPRKKH